MRRWLWTLPLFALLVAAFCFAVIGWMKLGGGTAIPLYGYIALIGGVVFSLLVGGTLMGLLFYSSRHGYDERASQEYHVENIDRWDS